MELKESHGKWSFEKFRDNNELGYERVNKQNGVTVTVTVTL
jgi:hypothetical protein